MLYILFLLVQVLVFILICFTNRTQTWITFKKKETCKQNQQKVSLFCNYNQHFYFLSMELTTQSKKYTTPAFAVEWQNWHTCYKCILTTAIYTITLNTFSIQPQHMDWLTLTASTYIKIKKSTTGKMFTQIFLKCSIYYQSNTHTFPVECKLWAQ